MKRLPYWFRQEFRDLYLVKERITFFKNFGVNTVCENAKCPNIGKCFRENSFTFMILGDTCTRECSFCAVKKKDSIRKSFSNRVNKEDLGIDYFEPLRIAQITNILKLDYVVITSVTRDDLSDGGAEIFVRTIKAIQKISPETIVEVLIPDFKGDFSSLEKLMEAQPSIIGHNLETVPRLYKEIRPKASYERSLEILKRIKQIKPEIFTKSSLLLGLGEEKNEILEAMQDLIEVGCDILVLGQYLSPSKGHFSVKRFLQLEEFEELKEIGLSLGFGVISSGPLVRSSYLAKQIYKEISEKVLKKN